MQSKCVSYHRSTVKEQDIEQVMQAIVQIKMLRHVAFIVDGNRRWAKAQGLSPLLGHRKGFEETVPFVCKTLWQYGVHTLSFWLASIANLDRDAQEVANYLDAAHQFLLKMTPYFMQHGVRVIHLGRKDLLPVDLRETIERLETQTQHHKNFGLNVAIAYSGGDEICRGVVKFVRDGNDLNQLKPSALIPYLDTVDQQLPSPDLIVRTAGEQRVTDFMPLQSTYSELLFIREPFPALTDEMLRDAIVAFKGCLKNG